MKEEVVAFGEFDFKNRLTLKALVLTKIFRKWWFSAVKQQQKQQKSSFFSFLISENIILTLYCGLLQFQ